MTSSPVSSTWTPPGQVPGLAVDGEELPQLGQDVVEASGLVAAVAGEGVAVHRVAGPHRPGGPARCTASSSGGSRPADVAGAEAGDEGQPARRPVRVEPVAERDHLVGRGARADLGADRVDDPRQELDVGAVELAGPLADPQQVGRAVDPVAGERVLPGQRLLVVEDQRLVARPEVDLVQAALGLEVDAAGRHEAQGPVDLAGDPLVAAALGRRGDELLVPGVDLGQVGEAALGEGPQQVERGRRLVVGGDQAVGVGPAGVGVERLVVDHVAAERVELDVADPLGRRRPGLGELPGDPADLDHRDAGGVGEGDGHLQDDLQLVADVVGREVGEGLGAVAGLEEEGLARRPPRPGRTVRLPGLAGEDQRRQGRPGAASTRFRASSSGQAGCWAAGRRRHERGLPLLPSPCRLRHGASVRPRQARWYASAWPVVATASAWPGGTASAGPVVRLGEARRYGRRRRCGRRVSDPGARTARSGLLGRHLRPSPRRATWPRRQRARRRPRPRPAAPGGGQRPVAEDRPRRAVTPAEDRFALVAAAADGVDRGRGQPDRDRPGRPELHRRDGRGAAPATPSRAGRPMPEIFLVVGADLVETPADLGAGGRSAPAGHPGGRVPARAALAPGSPPGWQVGAWSAGGRSTCRARRSGTCWRPARPVDGLVPDAVIRCIRRRDLYAVAQMTASSVETAELPATVAAVAGRHRPVSIHGAAAVVNRPPRPPERPSTRRAECRSTRRGDRPGRVHLASVPVVTGDRPGRRAGTARPTDAAGRRRPAAAPAPAVRRARGSPSWRPRWPPPSWCWTWSIEAAE